MRPVSTIGKPDEVSKRADTATLTTRNMYSSNQV